MDMLNGKAIGAHRAAWVRANGAIPSGMVVCHKCDNGLCVNVEHLFLGSMADNMKDCIKKGRFRYNVRNQKGDQNGNARPDYLLIKEQSKYLRSIGKTYSEIKRELGLKSNGHLRKLLIS